MLIAISTWEYLVVSLQDNQIILPVIRIGFVVRVTVCSTELGKAELFTRGLSREWGGSESINDLDLYLKAYVQPWLRHHQIHYHYIILSIFIKILN